MRHTSLYLLLVAMMIIWGFNVIAIKIIVTAFPPITITALRVLAAFFAILPFILYKKLYRKLIRKEWFYIIGISVFGIVGHQYFMSMGLNYTTAINGGIILGAAPIATAIAAAVFLGDKLTLYRGIGFFGGFVGVATVVLAGNNEVLSVSKGDLFFCISVVVQTVGFIFIKKVSETLNVTYITGLTLLIGSGLLLVLSLLTEPKGFSALNQGNATAWWLFLFSGIIATGLGYLIVNYAIQQVGASKYAVFLNLSPLFTVIASYFYLGESILITHWVGFALIVMGVLMGTGIKEKSHKVSPNYSK